MSSLKSSDYLEAQTVIGKAVSRYGKRLALQVSMQKTSGILIEMISCIAPNTKIIFVDTGVHFKETLELKGEFEQRYGVKITSVHPKESFEGQKERFGYYLHEYDNVTYPEKSGYELCCQLRKEVPFIQFVSGRFDAVIAGLRRASGGKRKELNLEEYDDRWRGLKIHPLYKWTDEMVDEYIAVWNVPVHPLYKKGYASIGCQTCTTPISRGEHARDGRWRHIKAIREKAGKITQPLYCGINQSDTQKPT